MRKRKPRSSFKKILNLKSIRRKKKHKLSSRKENFWWRITKHRWTSKQSPETSHRWNQNAWASKNFLKRSKIRIKKLIGIVDIAMSTSRTFITFLAISRFIIIWFIPKALTFLSKTKEQTEPEDINRYLPKKTLAHPIRDILAHVPQIGNSSTKILSLMRWNGTRGSYLVKLSDDDDYICLCDWVLVFGTHN